MTLDATARARIDALLALAGWLVGSSNRCGNGSAVAMVYG